MRRSHRWHRTWSHTRRRSASRWSHRGHRSRSSSGRSHRRHRARSHTRWRPTHWRHRPWPASRWSHRGHRTWSSCGRSTSRWSHRRHRAGSHPRRRPTLWWCHRRHGGGWRLNRRFSWWRFWCGCIIDDQRWEGIEQWVGFRLNLRFWLRFRRRRVQRWASGCRRLQWRLDRSRCFERRSSGSQCLEGRSRGFGWRQGRSDRRRLRSRLWFRWGCECGQSDCFRCCCFRCFRFLHLPSLSILCLLDLRLCSGCLHCRFLLSFGYLGILCVANTDQFGHLDLEGVLD
uniref:Uncharacterized protein n=1 Tax=uncultured marine group II/III euryarchaeote KM3_100_D04 TaxID=1457841 RepID=A0A075GA38_9EURY|nr:hypothetical protein [uncultured marine group II/III euryarchaeote KM3_100_D04]